MASKPVCEKMLELLFVRYLLLGFDLGEVLVFAPSSIEEFKEGYDSKITGTTFFRELYLQFKAPSYSKTYERFSFHTIEHQHERLKHYPENTAYYVVSAYASPVHLNQAQVKSRASYDFLKNFIAIEISSLPQDVKFFHYKPYSGQRKASIFYKAKADGETKKALHKVDSDNWLWGDQLVERFKVHRLGSLVNLSDEESENRFATGFSAPIDASQFITKSQVDHLTPGWRESEFGIHIRSVENPYV